MASLLRLGRMDESVKLSEEEMKSFFDLYHHPHGFARNEWRFRDDSRNAWYKLEAVRGERIGALSRFLQQAGFMPHATHDGIFGYITQAAVRLFQEYVRTIDEPLRHAARLPPCWPDGVVGKDTRYYIDAWRESGKRSRWAGDGAPTEDYGNWIAWLRAVAGHYRSTPTPLMQRIMDLDRRGDTLIPADWRYDPAEPHLVGLRRSADIPPPDGGKRSPDDLFVLLINGRSFYFSGSTDPNPRPGKEGYLTEGQHSYRFNWHNISARRRQRIYKAARPATEGVLVVRDVHDDDALTAANRERGLDLRPNPTFNIHWSGLGISNWSAGCQVISGSRYFNDAGVATDCRDYAARNDAERGHKRTPDGPRLTMGAYTVLSDLLLCYTAQHKPDEKPTFRYTLLQEETLNLIPGLNPPQLQRKLNRLRTP